MKILIKLRNNQEIETEIDEKDYEELKRNLTEGKIKFLNFENRLLKTSIIEKIEPVVETIPKEFRLTEPKWTSAGDATREGMKKLWDKLKSQGLFQGLNSYEEWKQEKRKMPA